MGNEKQPWKLRWCPIARDKQGNRVEYSVDCFDCINYQLGCRFSYAHKRRTQGGSIDIRKIVVNE